MALNGGIAYSGGICGAISGSALAVGMLAERRLGDHVRAKRIAREIVSGVLDDFAREHGAVNCRELIGMDLRAPGAHARFVDSGIWRTRCMAQIEFALRALAPLADPEVWERRVDELDEART
jgi:C_GCAxxG_C_C family probable redox protein